MDKSKRRFIQQGSMLVAGLGLGPWAWGRWQRAWEPKDPQPTLPTSAPEANAIPVMLSTWSHGMDANAAGIAAWKSGGSALDMIESGARVVESDPNGQSVGLGGLPDRDGHVTLDACVMDHTGKAGAVCFVQGIEHPLSLARRVMEDTPHVMLSGKGAEQFAEACGFPKRELLTPASRKAWEDWKQTSQYAPVINIENHDTIGLLALDDRGRLAGGCTTSGLAYKMHGRVGDSPIIGAGLFVDGEVGGATATGLGEAVMRTVGSFLVVELMLRGMTPQAACEEAVDRIRRKMAVADLQVGYLALNLAGQTGAHAIHPGFNYALSRGEVTQLIDATHG